MTFVIPLQHETIPCRQAELNYYVTRYLRIGNNEFRKELLQKFGREKSERLRKKVVFSEVNEKVKSAKHKCQPGSYASTSISNMGTLEVPKVGQTTKRKSSRKRGSAATSSKYKKKCKPAETVEESEHTCPSCKKVYDEGENWIACDLCDRWYDPVCAGLTDDQWTNVDNFGWYCAECQVIFLYV